MEIAGSEEVLADSPVSPNSTDLSVAEELVPVSADLVHSSEIAGLEKVFVGTDEGSVDSVVPDHVELVPDSVDVVPDSVDVVHCPRCGTFHGGGVFGEECYRARREARRCGRCGLLHEDYDLTSRWLDKMDKFDCEVYIPYVDKLQMDGNTIILPAHVIKKLDEHYDKMKKLEEEEKKKQQDSVDVVPQSIEEISKCFG